MTLQLRYAVRSDRGLVRGNNEDSVYAGPRLLAIADGMGGHAAGEVASKLAVAAIEHLDEDRPVGDLLAELRHAVEEANQRISDSIIADHDLDGMGTTLTALRFFGGQVGLVHVGDSRAYLLRGDHLAQITHDDTYVQSLVDAGRITAEEASHHPRKSVILRALMGAEVDPDVSIREARAGDRYLLCTDGLSDVVTAPTLLETLGEGDPQECADRLVELALRGGGPDNVTCIVADVIDTGFGDEVPVIGGAFVDPTDSAPSGDSSPAERAARMTHTAQPRHVEAPRRRRWLRRLITTAVILALLVGGTGGFYAWTQSQYFVGRSGDEVAVFRGVNTDFGPLKFYKVSHNTAIKMADLTPVARSQVDSGITAHSEAGAQRIVDNLQTQLLPLCPTPTPSPTPSQASTSGRATQIDPSHPTTARPTTSPPRTSAQAAPGGTAARSTAPRTTAPRSTAPRRSATASTLPSVVAPSPPPTATSPFPSNTQPGEGCR